VGAERFRRTARGYDPAQVDAAIAARDARLVRLEREAEQLAERVVEAEERMRDAVADGGDQPRTGGMLGKGLEEIYGVARRQATRIRMKALEDAVQIADRVVELSRLRDELTERVSELASRAGIQLGDEEGRPPVGTEPSGPADRRSYSGPVEVEVGPLRDFAQLTGFEDAASGIDGAGEIEVKGFRGGRATVSMNLDSPVELLRELEEKAPFEFKVRDTRRDRLVLEVDDDAEPGAS
jgi:hypothetical protein